MIQDSPQRDQKYEVLFHYDFKTNHAQSLKQQICDLSQELSTDNPLVAFYDIRK
jgi:hypothetical protein